MLRAKFREEERSIARRKMTPWINDDTYFTLSYGSMITFSTDIVNKRLNSHN